MNLILSRNLIGYKLDRYYIGRLGTKYSAPIEWILQNYSVLNRVGHIIVMSGAVLRRVEIYRPTGAFRSAVSPVLLNRWSADPLPQPYAGRRHGLPVRPESTGAVQRAASQCTMHHRPPSPGAGIRADAMLYLADMPPSGWRLPAPEIPCGLGRSASDVASTVERERIFHTQGGSSAPVAASEESSAS